MITFLKRTAIAAALTAGTLVTSHLAQAEQLRGEIPFAFTVPQSKVLPAGVYRVSAPLGHVPVMTNEVTGHSVFLGGGYGKKQGSAADATSYKLIFLCNENSACQLAELWMGDHDVMGFPQKRELAVTRSYASVPLHRSGAVAAIRTATTAH